MIYKENLTIYQSLFLKQIKFFLINIFLFILVIIYLSFLDELFNYISYYNIEQYFQEKTLNHHKFKDLNYNFLH